MIHWIKAKLQGKGKKLTWSSIKNYFTAKQRIKEVNKHKDILDRSEILSEQVNGAIDVYLEELPFEKRKEIEFKKAQAEWRTTQILEKSPECLEKGYCKHCFCDFPEKLYEDEACELGCYPKWMNEDTFKKFTGIGL